MSALGYFQPNNPRKPGFWEQIWQIIKRDWPFILTLIAITVVFAWFMNNNWGS